MTTTSTKTKEDRPHVQVRSTDRGPLPDLIYSAQQLRDTPRSILHSLFGDGINHNDW